MEIDGVMLLKGFLDQCLSFAEAGACKYHVVDPAHFYYFQRKNKYRYS